MSAERLSEIRDRMVPMLQVAVEQYQRRVPAGYPHLVDAVENGTFGIEIDPSHALFVTSNGSDLFAEIYRRNPRTDNRSSASRQKPAGVPFSDRRPLPANVDDQALRNLVAELMSYFNQQPGMIHITDD
ncbi:MAG: hypothetical protein QM589_15615 [Thermomicrobiales bacterium]